MLRNEQNERIYYDSLSNEQKDFLKDMCLKYLTDESQSNMVYDFLNKFFDCSCCNYQLTNHVVNESFLNMIENLNNDIEQIDEDKCNKIVEAVRNDIKIDFNEIKNTEKPFLMYIDKYFNNWLPNKIKILVLISYNKDETVYKEEFVGRIPFIIDENYRSFFIKIKNKTLNENIKQQIAAILFKSPKKDLKIETKIQEEILQDLLNIDFSEFPYSYFRNAKTLNI
ncbi:hypothetical protein NAPIS_ORF00377 [Vairimorpha apis BRL 01]|uniref:Uncharacterized protein n=1 Tax=Vairimorpha apis BRL 01 TaxID=1037528 RepID=T0MLB5_9MICR|nr:hypothetical protein NAPIS_ORF00604 [Vairimorpha apis BRL 01]EQB62047.1 hypothetical protein NAPIS_ORF00377 [Vairimorpha apis BRL 01]